MARIQYIPNRVIDSDGIADGAQVHIYQTGTTTHVALYRDAAFTQPLANPLIVPAGAEIPVFYADYPGNVRLRVVEDGGIVSKDEDPYIGVATTVDLDGKAPNTLVTQAAPGLMRVNDKIKTDGIVDLKADFGAVYDGLVNNTNRLNDAAQALQDGRRGDRGGRIDLGHYGKLLLADGAVIPRNIRIVGQFDPQKPRTAWNYLDTCPTALIIPPGKSILMDGSSIRNVLLWQANIQQSPETPEAFYAELAKYSGDAIVATGDDPYVVECMAIGFDWFARLNNVFNPSAYANIFDCNNGIEVTQCFEFGPYGISNNQARGVINQFRPWPWAVSRRPGTAIYIHDVADGLRVHGNVSYGWGKGLHLKNVFAVKASHISDGPAFHDGMAAAGTMGIHMEGQLNSCLVTHCHVDGQDFGYVIDTINTPMQLGQNTAGYCRTNQLVLGAGSHGDIGHLAVGGGCSTPITVLPGVGQWSGQVISTSNALSGNMIFIPSNDDANMLRRLRRVQIGTNLVDTYGPLWTGTFAQTANIPNTQEGDRIKIIDSNTTTYGATISGGGANSVLATFFNGAWIVA